MKTIYKAICAGLIVCGTLTSCNDFIDVEPKGVISEDLAMSQPDEMVTAAYAKLGDDWYTYPFNMWPYGDVSSDDAMKGGSGTTDTNYHPVEVWSTLPTKKNKFTSRHKIVKLQSRKTERMLKAIQNKAPVIYKGKIIRPTANFSVTTLTP